MTDKKNNSGDLNSGNGNSGNRNSGNRNSGDLNSGNRNSGYLNSGTSTVRLFNRDTGISWDDWDVEFPQFFFFDLVTGVTSSEMTEEEKEAKPEHKTTGGYLKVRNYQEAWRESWDKATDEDRRKVLTLHNWDNEVFKQITGIDVEKELRVNQPRVEEREEIVVDGVRYRRVKD